MTEMNEQLNNVYNVGFTVDGVEDEVQFDTIHNEYHRAVIDIMNCFLEFIKENKFENVEITYIEQVEELTEKEVIQNAIWDLEDAIEFMQCKDIGVGLSEVEQKLDDMRNSIERLYDLIRNW